MGVINNILERHWREILALKRGSASGSVIVGSSGITQLTGDVTAGPGSGSKVATIPGLALTDDGNSGTSKTIDWLSLKVGHHKLTLTGSVTLTFSNPVTGGVYVLLVYTGAGSFTVTWPGSVIWPDATAPTIPTAASKGSLATFIYDGSKYWGSFNQTYTP